MYVTDKLILPSGWNRSGWQRWRSAPCLHCPPVPEVSNIQRSGSWYSQGSVPCRGQLRRGWAPHRPGAGPGQVSQAWKYTFIMPTYTLCREYVVSHLVLGQFFEWVTTLGIEDHVRLDLNFRPGSQRCQPVQIICICPDICAFSVLHNRHCADICTICQKCQFEVRKGWQVL